MTLNKQATDQFLYNRVIPRYKEPLTEKMQYCYEPLKSELAICETKEIAFENVANQTGLTISTVRNRYVLMKCKGWF